MRSKCLVLVVVLAAIAFALPASAAIVGTSHEQSYSGRSGCVVCHLPHGAVTGGQRLWPSSITPNAAYVGEVSPLCGWCHFTGGVLGAAAISTTKVYGAASHGRFMSVVNKPWSSNIASSALPYAATTGVFECTTCHNVHDDAERPFLRDSIDEICARCHYNRHFVGGTLSQGATPAVGAWGLTNVGFSNPGSHPVGTDITGDVSGGVTTIAIPTATMNVVRSATVNGWTLGGHLTASGGVTCVTCHAVHGLEPDADAAPQGNQPVAAGPFTNFLAVEQGSGTLLAPSGVGRSVANGAGGATGDALCEACHGGANTTLLLDGSGNYGGAFKPNPGATGFAAHPVDDYNATGDAGVTAFPTDWPIGGVAATNNDPDIICESCHMPHPRAELGTGMVPAETSRTDVIAGAGNYLLRAQDNTQSGSFCARCHTGINVAGAHHPAGGIAYNSTGVAYLESVPGTGNSTDSLVCSTCHGMHSASGARLLTGGWLPAGNGFSGTKATDQFNVNMSKTCMDCHYTMVGGSTTRTVNPTKGVDNGVVLETEYQLTGTATHYIGLVHASATNWQGTAAGSGVTPTVGANMEADWPNTIPGATGTGYSRFGGTAASKAVVCESCHELQPSRNSSIHLLLGESREGDNGNEPTEATGNGRDAFCEACHGIPDGTHQTTGATVTRTDLVLSTDNTTNGRGEWLRGSTAILGDATLGTNQLACDGCHQVHNANTNSATFILEGPVNITFGTTTVPTVGAGTFETTEPSVHANFPVTTSTAGYTTPTLQNRGGSTTAYCDQCHKYAY